MAMTKSSRGARNSGRYAARHAEATKIRTRYVDMSMPDVWREYQRTQAVAIRNFLMEKFLPLVRYNAERIYTRLPDEVDIEDLMSAGMFGLMDAIDAFDLERQVKFETYCAPRIRGAILDELRSMDWVPRLVRYRTARVETDKGDEDNVALKAYFSGTGKLTKGAVAAGGMFAKDTPKSRVNILQPLDTYTAAFRMDLTLKSKYTSNVVLYIDNYKLIRECDETNNTYSFFIY